MPRPRTVNAVALAGVLLATSQARLPSPSLSSGSNFDALTPPPETTVSVTTKSSVPNYSVSYQLTGAHISTDLPISRRLLNPYENRLTDAALEHRTNALTLVVQSVRSLADFCSRSPSGANLSSWLSGGDCKIHLAIVDETRTLMMVNQDGSDRGSEVTRNLELKTFCNANTNGQSIVFVFGSTGLLNRQLNFLLERPHEIRLPYFDPARTNDKSYGAAYLTYFNDTLTRIRTRSDPRSYLVGQGANAVDIPGLITGQSTFMPTSGADTLWMKPGPDVRTTANHVSGGFNRDMCLSSAFGTGTLKADRDAVDLTLKEYYDRIPSSLVPIIRVLFQDELLFVAGKQFLSDGGSFQIGRGRYNREMNYLEIPTNETSPSNESVAFHEFCHYVLDKEDAVVGEAVGGGGVDHDVIVEILEPRYEFTSQIRRGVIPRRNLSQRPELFAGMDFSAIEEGSVVERASMLRHQIDSPSFVKGQVDRAIYPVGSRLNWPQRDPEYLERWEFHYSPDQCRDFAFLAAQNAEMVRGVLQLVADVSERINVPLEKVCATAQFIDLVNRFLDHYFRSFSVNLHQVAREVSHRALLETWQDDKPPNFPQ